MSSSIDAVVSKFGRYVTGQINITWDTEQTAGQFLEIREQGGVDGDPIEFTIEEFIEYVRSNTSDVIHQTLESYGQIGLEKEIFILDTDGTDVEA